MKPRTAAPSDTAPCIESGEPAVVTGLRQANAELADQVQLLKEKLRRYTLTQPPPPPPALSADAFCDRVERAEREAEQAIQRADCLQDELAKHKDWLAAAQTVNSPQDSGQQEQDERIEELERKLTTVQGLLEQMRSANRALRSQKDEAEKRAEIAWERERSSREKAREAQRNEGVESPPGRNPEGLAPSQIHPSDNEDVTDDAASEVDEPNQEDHLPPQRDLAEAADRIFAKVESGHNPSPATVQQNVEGIRRALRGPEL